MKNGDRMPLEVDQTALWTMKDSETVRLSLPPLPLAGMPEPLKVFVDFDVATVDATIDRLIVLRAQILPRPAKPGKRN